MCAWCQHRSEGSIKCPSTVVVDDCEFPSGFWVPKPGPLLEQMLQQSELCLQTLKKKIRLWSKNSKNRFQNFSKEVPTIFPLFANTCNRHSAYTQQNNKAQNKEVLFNKQRNRTHLCIFA